MRSTIPEPPVFATVNQPISAPLLRTPPGPWSNAIEIKPGARYLYTCGLVGVRNDGVVVDSF